MSADERESQLSAMFDGELPETECELLARRLSRDAALKQQWARYSLIGAVIRDEPLRARRDTVGGLCGRHRHPAGRRDRGRSGACGVPADGRGGRGAARRRRGGRLAAALGAAGRRIRNRRGRRGAVGRLAAGAYAGRGADIERRCGSGACRARAAQSGGAGRRGRRAGGRCPAARAPKSWSRPAAWRRRRIVAPAAASRRATSCRCRPPAPPAASRRSWRTTSWPIVSSPRPSSRRSLLSALVASEAAATAVPAATPPAASGARARGRRRRRGEGGPMTRLAVRPARTLLALVAFAGAALAAADEPREWLTRMNDALTTRNYDGTFFHVRDGKFETLRIIHRVQGRPGHGAPACRSMARGASSSAAAPSSPATCPTSAWCWSSGGPGRPAARQPAALRCDHGRALRRSRRRAERD